MLYPRAFAFVCLAGTCFHALRISISADLNMRDSHAPAECLLMKDSHSPAEYFQMRPSLLQESHIISKAHLDAFSMLWKSYSPAECLLPIGIMIEWCLIPQLALNEVPCLNASFSPVER